MPRGRPDEEKVVPWLRAKVDKHVCQTCGGERWLVGELVSLPLVRQPGTFHPVVVVQCAACASVTLFDAGSMGLRP